MPGARKHSLYIYIYIYLPCAFHIDVINSHVGDRSGKYTVMLNVFSNEIADLPFQYLSEMIQISQKFNALRFFEFFFEEGIFVIKQNS